MVVPDLYSAQYVLYPIFINIKNIITVYLNHDVAKFWFSHARFYQLRNDDLTLGYSKEHLIKDIFDPEFEKLIDI